MAQWVRRRGRAGYVLQQQAARRALKAPGQCRLQASSSSSRSSWHLWVVLSTLKFERHTLCRSLARYTMCCSCWWRSKYTLDPQQRLHQQGICKEYHVQPLLLVAQETKAQVLNPKRRTLSAAGRWQGTPRAAGAGALAAKPRAPPSAAPGPTRAAARPGTRPRSCVWSPAQAGSRKQGVTRRQSANC